MATARYVPDRTFWHLLFPYGATEQFVAIGEDGKEELITQTFDDEFLGRMLDARIAVVEKATEYGMSAQPIPCSEHHAIAHRLSGMDTNGVAPDRVGNCYGLSIVSDGKDANGNDIPSGIYGLIEWTNDSVWNIADGSYSVLSPTTWDHWIMRDGTAIPGPYIGEIGIVDVPALDTIGTLRECLPHDALQNQSERATPYVREVAETPDETLLAYRSVIPVPRHAGAMIMRHALHKRANAMEDEIKIEEVSPENVDAAENLEQLENEAPEVAEATRELLDRIEEAIDAKLSDETVIDTLVERLHARMSGATKRESEVDEDVKIEERESEEKDEEKIGGKIDLELRSIKAVARQAAADKVRAAAKNGSLPVTYVERALKLAYEGKDFSSLLVARSSKPAGTNTTPSTVRANNAAPSRPQTFNDSDVVAAVLRSNPGIEKTHRFGEACDKQRSAWLRAGAKMVTN